MDLSDYLMMLVETYNPNRYAKLVERPLKQFIPFLLGTVAISLLLFTIVTVPVLYHYTSTIPERLEHVNQLVLKADVNTTQPVELVTHPRIMLDVQANGTRSGLLTLSSEGILYPKYLLFGTATAPWNELQDLRQQTPQRDMLLTGMILFLLPSILFWFFLLSLFLLSLLFGLLVLGAYSIPRMVKHKMTLMEAVKVSCISMPSILLFGLGLYPLGVMTVLLVAILLTLVAYGIAIAVISEHNMPDEPRKHHAKV